MTTVKKRVLTDGSELLCDREQIVDTEITQYVGSYNPDELIVWYVEN